MNISAKNYSQYSFDEDGFLRLQKDLNYGLRHLDSQNVERLFTNQTQVQDENGLTKINGPLLDMYDTDNNLRLRAGYSTEDNEFQFKLYNQAGDPTIDLSDTGDALVYNIRTSQDAFIGKRLFIAWDSTQTVTETFTSGFQYEGGMFIRTPTSDFPVSGERHMAANFIVERLVGAGSTTFVSTVWPYSHGVRVLSSAFLGIYGQTETRIMGIGEIGDILTTNLTVGKSTNYMTFTNLQGLIYINDFIYETYQDSTELQGTFIGPFNTREVYLSDAKNSSDRVACEGTQRIYDAKSDLIYYYQRNMRHFDESHSTDWVAHDANANVVYSGGVNTISRLRPVVRNSTTGAQYIQMSLSTNEGLVAFDALSFNDGNAVSTDDDWLVWSFNLQNSSNIDSSGCYLSIGNSSDDNYEFRPVDIKALVDGWNYVYFHITDKRAIQGAPNLNAVTWMRIGFRKADVSSVNDTYLGHNFVGIIRAHPDNSTSPLCMQRLDRYTLDWDAVGYSAYNHEVCLYDTYHEELIMTDLYPHVSVNHTYLNQQHRDSFSAKVDFICASTFEAGPIIGQLFDNDNYWYAYLYDAELKIYVHYNSSQYLSVSKALTDLPPYYSECEMYVSRSHNGYIDIEFRESSLYGCLEGYLPDAWYYQRENVYLGNPNSAINTYRLLNLEVKPYDK